MDDEPIRPFLSPVFSHTCRSCGRRKLVEIDRLGSFVKCPACGRLELAADADSQSAALLDPLKHHAELADMPQGESYSALHARWPR
jgi:predicted RNA-binding Zn-ribbon protein involved in translation (DUF1610 family)